MNICLHAKFQVWWCYGFAVQLFNKIKLKKKKTKNLIKHVLLYFPDVMSKYMVNLFFLYVLDIDVARIGNKLKLKVKSEFS